jgi:hypothetical protein
VTSVVSSRVQKRNPTKISRFFVDLRDSSKVATTIEIVKMENATLKLAKQKETASVTKGMKGTNVRTKSKLTKKKAVEAETRM